MKKFIVTNSVVPTVLYISACADTLSATHDEVTIVQGYSNLESDPAGQMAAEHCAQFGKVARLKSKTGRMMRYSCLPGS